MKIANLVIRRLAPSCIPQRVSAYTTIHEWVVNIEADIIE